MNIEFYLDVGCTFLLNMVEILFCCDRDKYSVDQDARESRRTKWKGRVLLIRVTLGFIFNITAFVTVKHS